MYREKWGNTPWTAVEAAAIEDSCLANAYRTLFFFVVEPTMKFPSWLPDTHVRFNYGEFSIDEAVGAIKARVLDSDKNYKPPTPESQAEILKAQQDLQYERSKMRTSEGIKTIFSKVRELFNQIEIHCEKINGQQDMEIHCGKHLKERDIDQVCSLSDGHVGLTVIWRQRFNASLDNVSLTVREFSGNLLPGLSVHVEPPQELSAIQYVPYMSPAFEYGWRPVEGTEFVSSAALAAQCVSQFIDLVARYNRGEIERSFFTGQGGWT